VSQWGTRWCACHAVGGWPRADDLHDRVVLGAGPVGRLGRGQVGDAQEQLSHGGAELVGLGGQRLLGVAQLAALGLAGLGLLDLAVATQAAHLLGDGVDPGPQVVSLRRHRPSPLVETADLVELVDDVASSAGQRGTYRVELAADPADVDHAGDVSGGVIGVRNHIGAQPRSRSVRTVDSRREDLHG
jgi:hypothetical protein